MKYDTFLFDMDGTLLDSCQGVFEGIRRALIGMGEPVPEELRRFMGPPLKRSFLEFCGMTEERADRAVTLFREYYSTKGIFQCSLYPGVADTLRGLRERGCRLAVATCKTESYAMTLTEHFGITGLFDTVVGSVPDGSRVTKEQVIRLVLERLPGGSPVMVGDRFHDVLGAKACGLGCIGALYGYGSREELEESGACEFISSPMELLEL